MTTMAGLDVMPLECVDKAESSNIFASNSWGMQHFHHWQ